MDNHCKNCDTPFAENQKYCTECGQKTDTHRINFHFLVHEVRHGIFHVDRGILFTLKELLTRPGFTIKEYIDGKRQKHFKPVLLIMILGSIAVLLQKWRGSKKLIETNMEINPNEIEFSNKNIGQFIQYIIKTGEWIDEHLSLFLLFQIPLFALVIYLLFRRFRRYNYSEWLVICTFITAQGFILYIVKILIGEWFAFDILYIILGIGMMIWTMLQMFSEYPKSTIIIRTLAVNFIYFITFTICIVLALTILGFILKVYN